MVLKSGLDKEPEKVIGSSVLVVQPGSDWCLNRRHHK